MSLKKLFFMGSCPLSNNLDLVKPWVQHTDCWGINNVGMIWDTWKNGHSSKEYILIYFGYSDTFGNTELSFSCRIRKSPGVQRRFKICLKQTSYFSFQQQTATIDFSTTGCNSSPFVFCFGFVLRRNFQVSMNSWDLGVNYPDNISNSFFFIGSLDFLSMEKFSKESSFQN